MKTEEDEAFDDLARRQGMWGGGFTAKRAMAADKYSDIVSDGGLDPRNQFDAQPAHCQCTACKDGVIHASDCAVHNGPAYPAGECDCGVAQEPLSEVLKLALEALEEYADQEGKTRAADEAITAIKAALAQPAQEPKFWEMPDGKIVNKWGLQFYNGVVGVALYTYPPKREWVGLTDDELADLWYKESLDWMEFARAHEAALKEKNNG